MPRGRKKKVLEIKHNLTLDDFDEKYNKSKVVPDSRYSSMIKKYYPNKKDIPQWKDVFNPTEKEWKAYWFAEYNDRCKECKKKCKQSSKVQLVYCPDYEKINKLS